jgi:hypothetical protein
MFFVAYYTSISTADQSQAFRGKPFSQHSQVQQG